MAHSVTDFILPSNSSIGPEDFGFSSGFGAVLDLLLAIARKLPATAAFSSVSWAS
jgi:hypothetical protein